MVLLYFAWRYSSHPQGTQAMATNPYEPAGVGRPPETSGMAIASFVCGLFSFVTCVLTGIPAIILGIISLGKINRSGGALKGSGLATAGIVMGSVGSLLMTVAPIFIALLLPALQSAREAARRNASTNNLKQIGLALHNYHDVYKSFPPRAVLDANGRPLLSWRVLILPYMEHQALYEQFRLDEPWDSAHNRPLLDRMPEGYASPSSAPDQPGTTLYQVPVGPGTAFDDPSKKLSAQNFPKGLASAIFVVETYSDRAVNWTEPQDLSYDPVNPRHELGNARSAGIFLALMGDGSVRTIGEDVDDTTLQAMLAPRAAAADHEGGGGEPSGF